MPRMHAVRWKEPCLLEITFFWWWQVISLGCAVSNSFIFDVAFGTGALFTGIYGMWNVYVFSLVILYAPSSAAPITGISLSLKAITVTSEIKAYQETDKDGKTSKLFP